MFDKTKLSTKAIPRSTVSPVEPSPPKHLEITLPMPKIQQDIPTESLKTTKYQAPQAYHAHLIKNNKKILIKAAMARKFFNSDYTDTPQQPIK